ncbi:hydrolase, alpha/beta domain protein [Aeromicrobium marinum DSM 15272]|uniref:Hydrolase, alpha/beta domain protein n=1 Tax=Aeromicrobium marinum DSM 15272 TaxID=585531 RepID=E2SCI6_9ACTN|nr:alpha/beta fold hydrolase [Aeromicrobium marinum]EFQ82939.1 hydrolase, alpha/beta domain protein [Aeromicrobium marinum DSM 15272]
MADVAGPRTLEVDLPRLRASALAWGPDDGPLVLCLHGFPDTAWTWRAVAPLLAAQGYRVVAPFLRGYPPTARPDDRDFHVGALMSDAIEWHAALGADDRAAVVGHDWGALAAHGLAAHGRSPFSRVVAMAVPAPVALFRPWPHPLRWIRAVGPQLLLSWYTVVLALPGSDRLVPRLVPFLWRRWSPGHDAAEDLELLAAAMATREGRQAMVAPYRATIRVNRPDRAYRALQADAFRAARVPVRYLHGADDGCVHAGFAERARAVLPQPDVHVVPGAGHFLQVERPDVVAALLLDHLAP